MSANARHFSGGGKQYIAVMTGENLIVGQMAALSGTEMVRGDNRIYVFALPD